MESTSGIKKAKSQARDLSKTEPRPAHEELGGFQMAARTLDKCRLTLAGIQGDFMFGCPMDQEFFRASGVDQAEFKEFVALGATDQEVDAWLRERARRKS